MRAQLIAAYLDYTNNYMTIAKFAEHNGLTMEQGQQLITLARSVYNTAHPDA